MDELDRLFQRVVRAVRDTRPENLSRPLEVGELLALVPYRLVRADVGVETNDDFAHAVTRLLAGERGYLFVDDLMQDDLKAELASPNPNLLAYRAYSNTRVTLSQEHARRLLEQMGASAEPGAPPEPPPASAVDESAARTPARPPASASAAAAVPHPKTPAPAPPPARTPDPRTMPQREAGSAPRPPRPVSSPRPLGLDSVTEHRPARPGCKYCGQALPEGREVRYCPACGQNLLVRRCAACSAELEPAWKFCVACGRAAAP